MPIPTPALLPAATTGAPTLALSGRRARNEPVGLVIGHLPEIFSTTTKKSGVAHHFKLKTSIWERFTCFFTMGRVFPDSFFLHTLI
jgi:hypothetical protein